MLNSGCLKIIDTARLTPNTAAAQNYCLAADPTDSVDDAGALNT